MLAADPAMPVRPKAPEMIAKTKKVMDQLNMISIFQRWR